MSKFVKTYDKDVAEKLRLLGFRFINEQGGLYTFINSGVMQFSEEDKKKMTYTDIINL